jgi:hypothetical protein
MKSKPENHKGGRTVTPFRTFAAFLGVAALLVAPFALVHAYVATGAADGRIAAALQQTVGAPVRIAGASFGGSGLAMRQLQVFGATGDVAPWLEVGVLSTDVTTWDLLRGQTAPRAITLTNAALTLDFDADGRLRTSFGNPASTGSALPTVHIEGAKVVLHQEGRPPLIVSGVRGTVVGKDGGVELTGTAADPQWGDWDLQFTLDQSTNRLALTAKSAKVQATRSMLEGLPFVPAVVWQQVHADGEIAVDLTVRIDPARSTANYRVAVEPLAAAVGVTSVGLALDAVTGRLVIEDGGVQLRDVRARTADGTLECRADLDFRGAASRLQFDVSADRIDVQKLPAGWSIPKELLGHLSGRADLTLTIAADGKLQTTGDGQGVITDARLRIGDKEYKSTPVRLTLSATEGGFEFRKPTAEPHPVRP